MLLHACHAGMLAEPWRAFRIYMLYAWERSHVPTSPASSPSFREGEKKIQEETAAGKSKACHMRNKLFTDGGKAYSLVKRSKSSSEIMPCHAMPCLPGREGKAWQMEVPVSHPRWSRKS